MKRLYLIYGASALAAALMAAQVSVHAQENGNRDEFGDIIRGPYETNGFGDNWFIGLGGGINMLLDEGYDVKPGASLDVNFGKWFTPSVGMRAGYQGLDFFSAKDGQTDKYGYMYLHGDFLWNASNAISGYKETRFWDLTPYLHAGFFRSNGTGGSDFADNEFAAGAGLLHNLRISERLDAVIDMRATVVKGSIHGTSGAVEAANLEKTEILETAIVALEVANASLEAENTSLKKKNSDLSKKVNNLKAEEAVYEMSYEQMQPITVYFTIGKAVLDQLELQHLDFYARNIIDKVNMNPNAEIVVMGSADSNTGTAKRNKHLSEARGEYIVNLLAEKYGISKERVVVKSEVVKAASDPKMDRAVIISFK